MTSSNSSPSSFVFLPPDCTIGRRRVGEPAERIAPASVDPFAPTASDDMSFIGRIIAGARELPFGGPLGALLARAARHIPSWQPHGDAEGAEDDPRRRIAFTIAVIAL